MKMENILLTLGIILFGISSTTLYKVVRLERRFMSNNSENISTDDELYEEAKKIVIAAHQCSVSLLQRKLKLGYARAARLVDMLEEGGIVAPAHGAEPHKVLINKNIIN